MAHFGLWVETNQACRGSGGESVAVVYSADPGAARLGKVGQLALAADTDLEAFVSNLREHETVAAVAIARLCSRRVHGPDDQNAAPRPMFSKFQVERQYGAVFADEDSQPLPVQWRYTVEIRDTDGLSKARRWARREVLDPVLFLPEYGEPENAAKDSKFRGHVIEARSSGVHVALTSLTRVVRPNSSITIE